MVGNSILTFQFSEMRHVEVILDLEKRGLPFSDTASLRFMGKDLRDSFVLAIRKC